MKVTLVQKPTDPMNTIYVAARTCYSEMSVEGIIEEAASISHKEKSRLVRNVIKSGHHSVLEHVSFTFSFDGMSRVATHQLVRHRLAAYSQQSQRYVRMDVSLAEMEKNAPPKISSDPDRLKAYLAGIEVSIENYNNMVEEMLLAGSSKEEACENARMLLPNAIPSNILVTMNLRELIHVCNVRLCTRAQEEIRSGFTALARLISTEIPFLTHYLVPKCRQLGYCPEHKSCGMIKFRRN